MNPDLTKEYLIELFTACKGKDILFDNPNPGILIRHDVDDDLDRSVRMAELQHSIGVKATYFILNTAPYWEVDLGMNEELFNKLRHIESLGHSIQWHNNSIAEYKSQHFKNLFSIADCIKSPLFYLRSFGFKITGSASHGDPLCHKHGFINYEVFSGPMGERTREAVNFKQPDFIIPKIDPKDFGLEWEAYHVPYDEYYSEAGGRWKVKPDPEHFRNFNGRIQLLIHPQWWSI